MTAPSGRTANVIRLGHEDNVVVARHDIAAGQAIDGEGCTALEAIRAGHKVAVRPIEACEAVLKYGLSIGRATEAIAPGAHVHTHNLGFEDAQRVARPGSEARPTVFVKPDSAPTFEGFARSDGRAGTRNYVGIISTVNCSATVARQIAGQFNDDQVRAEFPCVDGVVALTHGSGCAMAEGSIGYELFRRVITGYLRHPNFGAVLLVGLGCEVFHIRHVMDLARRTEAADCQIMAIQDSGGTRQTVEQGTAMVRSLLVEANRAKRTPQPIDQLVVALQCGGSDGYSGITANPALGAAADRIVRHGGTAILSETPEIYGAEHLLLNRAINAGVAAKLVAHIDWWKEYTSKSGTTMDANPAPGNKEGGLTTIVEKSMGALMKGGSTNLVDVIDYAEPVSKHGLVFMDSPGFDPAAVTGQIAAGATLVCFTTGRGTVAGYKPAPALKIATNSEMYRHLSEDMDINSGVIADGIRSVDDIGEEIFRAVVAAASGARTKSEQLGFGDNEFAPWQLGAIM